MVDVQSPFDPMATNVQVLRYLVAVADTGSFRKAAELAYVSQPSLSAAIAQWEKRMDCTLFERSRRGVHITAAGERVCAAARKVLAALEQLENIPKDAKPPFYGPLRFGVIPTVGPYALPYIHEAVHEVFPEMEMPIFEGTTDSLCRDLLAGRIDCALLAILPGMTERFESSELYSEPFLVALPKEHPLAEEAEIDATAFPQDELLLLEEGHCLRDQALEVCQLQAEQIDGPNYRATSLETLRHIVASGHGITLLPSLATRQEMESLRIRPLTGEAHRIIGLIWRKNDERFDAFQQFTRALRRFFPKDLVQIL